MQQATYLEYCRQQAVKACKQADLRGDKERAIALCNEAFFYAKEKFALMQGTLDHCGVREAGQVHQTAPSVEVQTDRAVQLTGSAARWRAHNDTRDN